MDDVFQCAINLLPALHVKDKGRSILASARRLQHSFHIRIPIFPFHVAEASLPNGFGSGLASVGEVVRCHDGRSGCEVQYDSSSGTV